MALREPHPMPRNKLRQLRTKSWNMAKIRTDADFIASLNGSQRHYFLEREQDSGRRLQRTLLELGRGLSAVSDLHGQSVAALLECMTRVDRPTGPSHARAGGEHRRS